VEAIKRAKEIYPDKKGKWTAELVDEEMYKNMRGGAAYEAKIRLERKKARAAERASAPPSRARARRNGTHIHADLIDHLDVAKVHNPSRYTEAYLDENSRRGKGRGFTPGTFLNYNLKGTAKRYASKYLRALEQDLKSRSDVVADRSQNGGTAYYRIVENPYRRNPMIDYSTARDIYSARNNAGLGFGIGDDSDDIGDAALATGWQVLQRYDASLLLATDSSGNHFLVGGDGVGRGAWVIRVPAQIDSETTDDPDDYYEEDAYEY
jgi:hypothetical protein